MKGFFKRFKWLITLACAGVAAFVSMTAITVAWFTTCNVIQDDIGGSTLRSYFHAGSGTSDDPFTITRPIHLYNLHYLQDELEGFDEAAFYFQLGDKINSNDPDGLYFYSYDENGKIGDGYSTTLNMAGYSTGLPPCGNDEHPFLGTFDGSGLTVSNLKIVGSFTNDDGVEESYCDLGIFGYIGETGSIKNVYYESPTIDVTDSDSTQSESDAHESHDDSVYVGYLVGHIVYAANIEHAYVNNCTISGTTTSTASSPSTMTNYGYIGYAKYAGDATSPGTELGNGNSYEFSLQPEYLYNAIYDAVTNHGSDPLVTRNWETDVTSDSGTEFGDTLTSTTSTGNALSFSKSYYLGGKHPQVNSATNYSLSTIGWYGATTTSCPLFYYDGQTYTALSATIASSTKNPESISANGKYIYYDSSSGYWKYFEASVKEDGTTTKSCTLSYTYYDLSTSVSSNQGGWGQSSSSTTYYLTASNSISASTSSDDSTHWCLLKKQTDAETATEDYNNGIDASYGETIGTGSYYLYNPSTGLYVSGTSTTQSGWQSTTTFSASTSQSDAVPVTISIASSGSSTTYKLSYNSYYVYVRSNWGSIGVSGNTSSSSSFSANAATSSTTHSVTSTAYETTITLGEYPIYYLKDNVYTQLVTEDASLDSEFLNVAMPDEGSGNTYFADTDSMTSSGYVADNIDIVGGLYIGVESSTGSSNYCLGIEGYGDDSINISSSDIGNTWYTTSMVSDAIVLFIQSTGNDTLGSISYTYSINSGTGGPAFYTGQSKVTVSDLGSDASTTESTSNSVSYYTSNIALTTSNVGTIAACTLDSDKKILSVGGSIDTSDSNIAYYVLCLGVQNGGSYVYNIDFEYDAPKGTGIGGSTSTSCIVDYRSSDEKVDYSHLTFYCSFAAGTTIKLRVSFASGVYTLTATSTTQVSFYVYLYPDPGGTNETYTSSYTGTLNSVSALSSGKNTFSIN